jgi:predicted transcriptional regulator
MALPKLATPKYTLTVPSSGKKVSYRPYLVKEEKILMMALEADSEIEMIRAVKDIIQSCTEGELTEKDITLFDLEYFFTHLRAKSVGEHSKVYLGCNNCDHKQEASIDLTESKVIGVPSSSSDYIKNINEETKVKLRFPTIDRVLDILSKSENASDIDLAYKVIMDSLDEIYYGDEVYDAKQQSEKELQEFVESMNTKQFDTVRTFVEEGPTVCIDHNFKCEKCGHENEHQLKGIMNFFS